MIDTTGEAPQNPLTRRELFTGRKENRHDRLSSAIQHELGIGNDRVDLDMAFGNHVLTREYLAMIRPRETDILTGELEAQYVWLNLQNPDAVAEAPKTKLPLLERIKKGWHYMKFPGEGATPAEMAFGANSLRALYKQGLCIASADVPSTITQYDEKAYTERPWGVIALAASAITVGCSSISAPILIRQAIREKGQQNLYTRKAFLAGAGLAGLGVTGAGLAINRMYSAIKGSEADRNITPVEVGTTSPEDPPEAPNLDGEQSAFEDYEDAKVKLRNKIMAHNTWVSVAEASQQADPQAILFYAGNGHTGVYTDFLSGPRQLEADIEEYADRLCTHTLDFVTGAIDEEVPTQTVEQRNTQISFVLQNYLGYFNDPVFYRREPGLSFGSPELPYYPRSPRTILIDTLIQKIYEARKDGLSEAQRRAVLYDKMLSNVIDQLSQDRESPRTTRNNPLEGTLITDATPLQAEGIRASSYLDTVVNREKTIAFLAEDPEPPRPAIVQRDEAAGGFVRTGIAKYRGSYHPVYRKVEFDQTNGTLVAANYVQRYDGGYVRFEFDSYEEIDHQEANKRTEESTDKDPQVITFTLEGVIHPPAGNGLDNIINYVSIPTADLPSSLTLVPISEKYPDGYQMITKRPGNKRFFRPKGRVKDSMQSDLVIVQERLPRNP